MKIATEKQKREPQEASKGSLGSAVRAMLVGAGGGAVGYGLAEAAGRGMQFFREPTGQRLQKARIILPILLGTSAMLADRYRHSMNQEYSKVRGFGDRDKK